MTLKFPAATLACALGLAGCSHVEIWEGPDYVHPGSIEYSRLAERLDTLYSMSCRVGSSGERRQYIISGTRVALRITNSRDCTKAIPYAICYSPAHQDPTTMCRRID